jgi:hypothetical protein
MLEILWTSNAAGINFVSSANVMKTGAFRSRINSGLGREKSRFPFGFLAALSRSGQALTRALRVFGMTSARVLARRLSWREIFGFRPGHDLYLFIERN